MRRFARASQRFGSPVQCGFALYPGSTRLITSARDSTRWRQLSSSSPSSLAEHHDIPHHVYESIPPLNGLHYRPVQGSPSTSVLDDVPTGALDVGELPHTGDPQTNVGPLRTGERAQFWAIMEDGQPDLVMGKLLNPRFRKVVAEMPSSTFAEVFRLLSPAYFIEPFHAIFRSIHPTTMHVHGYKRLELIFEDFAKAVMAVAEIRRSAGHQLGLAEYTHLLHCASSIGDATMADLVRDQMKEDEIQPDTTCYNHLMVAKVWHSALAGRQHYRLRITKHIYRKRGFLFPNPGWDGFGTKERSVRKQVTKLLHEMIEEGLQGDEKTFIQVLVSSSRVGNPEGIKRLLKAVWNVDVDALVDTDSNLAIEPVTPFQRSSPVYPTKNLLVGVAHAFGTASDMLAALRAIEHISESYGLAVPEEVWIELLEWAFVLSRKKWGPDIEGKNRGLVEYDFVMSLYETMTSAPFHVRPTARVHWAMAKTAFDQCDLPLYKQHMEAIYNLLAETRRQRRKARDKVMGYLNNTKASQGPKHRPGERAKLSRYHTRHFANAVHEYDLLRIRAAQEDMIVQRLVRLLVIRDNWRVPGEPEHAWERRYRPHALEEWQDYLPDQMHWETSGGEFRRKGYTNWRFQRHTGFHKIPIRRPTPQNGLKREFHPSEIEDDAFWTKLLNRRPWYITLATTCQPISRLFTGVVERSTVAHPQPHDPFSYEPLADLQTSEEIKEFYREHDFTTIVIAQEAERELGSEDPADTALEGFSVASDRT